MKTNKKLKFITSNDEEEEEEETGEDRLSKLPDELIHHILWFSDLQLLVQTSVLSKRWKLVWTSLPFLNLFVRSTSDINYIHKLLAHRNHRSQVLKLDLTIGIESPQCLNLVEKVIDYAILHRVQKLNVDLSIYYPYDDIILSRFKSSSLNQLTLSLFYDEDELVSDCWELPVLTTLHLIRPYFCEFVKLPESYLTCLPCLQTLLLDGFELPKSICLPTLTTLILYDVEFTSNVSEFFYALVNLRNLTLLFRRGVCANFVVNCPKLVKLEIENYTYPLDMINDSGKVMVLAPNVCSFSCVNFCPITFGVAKLDKVDIRLEEFDMDGTQMEIVANFKETKNYCRLITDMFWGLSSAKILTLDLKTVEALSALANLLVYSPPPFFNLEYVKVPHGFNESSMSSDLKCYLLGRSPKASIVTTLPQKTMIPPTKTFSLTAQTVMLQKPLAAAPTKVLISSEYIHKTMSVNTLDMGVQEEHLVKNSLVNADKVTQIGVPVQGRFNNQESSSRGDSDVGLWQGHVVNSEFVCLLDCIMNKYPETFELFTTTSKKLSTFKLNMLGNSVSVFTKLSMTQVDTEMIAEHRVLFDALHKLGFNISWLVNRLNYIEELCFSQPLLSELHAIDCHIDNAKYKLKKLHTICNDDIKTELQDLHTLRAEKMQQVQKAFGTMGENFVVGYIGGDLLSGP